MDSSRVHQPETRPSHSPSFKSSVTVNGVSFECPVYFKHIKESQSEAAKLAYDHFTAPTPTPATSSTLSGPIEPVLMPMPTLDRNVHGNLDTNTSLEAKHMYKNQLQTYAQKRNLGLPEYSCKREGPLHLSRFTCKVSIAENTFQCRQSFPKLKEAEHAAAKLALTSLTSPGLEVYNDSTLIYKNLLQELSQKQGFHLPIYSTKSGGVPHMRTFLSTVEVKGETFQGEEAKTKKQAEMNAAKAAYISIKQRGTCKSQDFITADCQPMGAASSSSKSTSMADLQEIIRPEPISCTGVLPEKHVQHENAEDQKPSEEKLVSSHESPIPNRNDGLDARRKRDASQIPHPSLENPRPYFPSLPEGGKFNCSSGLKSSIKVEQPTGTTNMSPHKKVCIFSRKLNMKHPHGVDVFSDDK